MAFISSKLATAQLRKGLSEHVVEFAVGDIDTVRSNEVAIQMLFREDTPLDQVITDRNLVRDRFYEMVNDLTDEPIFILPYFSLDMEGEEREARLAEAADYE